MVKQLIFVVVAAFLACSLPPGRAMAAPQAILEETSYNFGKAWQGDTVMHIFKLKNGGNAELKFEKPKITGNHTTVMMKKSLPPGGEMGITVAMDTPGDEGEVKTGAILYTNDPKKREIELKMRGRVRPMISLTPMGALYFSVYQGTAGEKAIDITNHYETPIKITRVEQKSERFETQLQTIEAGQKYRLVVRVNPRAVPGRTMEKVTLFTDCSKRPELSIGVNIFVKQDVYVFPDRVDFGKVSLTEIEKKPENLNLLIQTLQVKRREGKGQDFQAKLEYDIPQITVKKTPESGSETYRLDVALVPEKLKPGKIDSYITVHTNDKEVPELKIPVKGEFF